MMSSFVGSIEVCPIRTCIIFLPFHAQTVFLQDNGLNQKKALGLRTWSLWG